MPYLTMSQAIQNVIWPNCVTLRALLEATPPIDTTAALAALAQIENITGNPAVGRNPAIGWHG
tara:strand:- start:94 stop:282 length:189 start_codon:yes stop_codon:yes gene_type:complete